MMMMMTSGPARTVVQCRSKHIWGLCQCCITQPSTSQ